MSGLFRDILDNAWNPDGKILNGLDFPKWDENPKDCSAYATDVVAWDYVRGKPHCGNFTIPYPTAHMRWGLAGTANTMTSFHIDSDGFSTFLWVICGKKVWGISHAPELPLSSIDVFLDENLEAATHGIEAIVLRPGDLL